MCLRSQTAWFIRRYFLIGRFRAGAPRHSLFKTYHGRETAAGAMDPGEGSPLCAFC